jgi:hypothetical protein
LPEHGHAHGDTQRDRGPEHDADADGHADCDRHAYSQARHADANDNAFANGDAFAHRDRDTHGLAHTQTGLADAHPDADRLARVSAADHENGVASSVATGLESHCREVEPAPFHLCTEAQAQRPPLPL